jgi:adenine phosphoribosyltransferase
MDLRSFIRDVKDYPKEGILFFDITPLLAEGRAFAYAIDAMAEQFQDIKADKIIAAEARGFIFGAPLAYKMGLGFIPVRKPGKLPYKNVSVSYELEYGTDTLCMHEDAIQSGERILVIDDLIATGGTVEGMIKLVQSAQGQIAGIGFLIELGFLKGKQRLNGLDHICLLTL